MLARRQKQVADELLPSVETLLYTGEAAIRQQAVEDMVSLLDQFAVKGSPRLKGDLRYIRDALCAGAIMDALQVIVIE